MSGSYGKDLCESVVCRSPSTPYATPSISMPVPHRLTEPGTALILGNDFDEARDDRYFPTAQGHLYVQGQPL